MTSQTILVVEDLRETRLLLEAALKRHYRYNVITAQSAEEALEKIASNQVDLIITDHSMPVMNGLAFVSKLRMELKSEIPIIVITSHLTTDLAASYQAVNVTLIFQHPLNMAHLLDTIKDTLGDNTQIKILLVEDDHDVGRLFQLFLEREYDVVWVRTADLARSELIIRGHEFSGAVFNHVLWNDKTTMLEVLRSLPQDTTIPRFVLTYSGTLNAGEINSYKSLGMVGLLQKPLDQSELLRAVEQMMAVE